MKIKLFCFFILLNLIIINNINAQWLYNQEVTINSTGVELNDFQIAVTLNNQNFNYSLTNPDGSDIRFSTDSTFNFSPDIQYYNK